MIPITIQDIQTRSPITQWQVVDVVVSIPYTDTVVRHGLNQAAVRFVVADRTSEGMVFRGTKTPTAQYFTIQANKVGVYHLIVYLEDVTGIPAPVASSPSQSSTPVTSHGFASKAHKAATQVIATGAETALTFDTNDYDIGGVHSTTTNPTRFTVPVGGAGMWLLAATWLSAPAAATVLRLRLYKNGAIYTSFGDVTMTPAGEAALSGALPDLANDGDFYEFFVVQTTGGNLNTVQAQTYGTATKLN